MPKLRLVVLLATAVAAHQPNCEDLWAKAGVQSSASFTFGGVKGQGILYAAPQLTQGTSYTMEMTASSTCTEEFVVGLQGGGGWMFNVIPTSWQGERTLVETAVNPGPTNYANYMTVRSSLKAAMACTTVNRGGDRRLLEDGDAEDALDALDAEHWDEDPRRELGDNSETVCNLNFPRCNVVIKDITLYATSCYDTTAAPMEAPTEDCDALYLAGPISASTGNQVATIDALQNYQLSFTMQTGTSGWITTSGWKSIFRIGANSRRNPGIWITPGTGTTQVDPGRIHVTITGSPHVVIWDEQASPGVDFAEGATYGIRVTVQSGVTTVFVDSGAGYVQMGTASGTPYAPLPNQPVYVGDPDHVAADVTLTDVCLTSPRPTAAPTYSKAPTISPTIAPTVEPSSKPTQTTTTAVAPPLPPKPQRYFATLFDCVIGPVIPAIKNEETPVQVRYTALFDTMTWNCMAIYSPTWKDAITKQRPFLTAPASKHDTDTRTQCAIAAAHHFTSIYLTESRPTIEAAVESVSANYLGYTIPLRDTLYPALADCGLQPARQKRGKLDAFMDPSSSTDEACVRAAVEASGWAPDVVGQAVAESTMGWAARDGWNSLGDLDRDGDDCTANQRPFRDTTSYAPFTAAPGGSAQDPSTWTRWQPLEEDTDEGFFFFQEHVTPHIGTKAKMRVISDADRAARTAPAPNYDYTAEANLAIQRVSALTDTTKAEVEWFNDKLNILITTFGTLLNTGRFSSFEMGCAYLVGYTNTEYDATVVVWKEKRAHDLIRPTSWIQENFKDDEFLSYAGPYEGIQTIRGKDWVPYKRVMPHSEYPSGSACICKGIQQFTDAFMLRAHGEASLGIAATFPAGSSSVEPGLTPAADVPLVYPTMSDMAATCGRSRFDGGMHFTASVPAAETLCDGIGDAGFAFATEIFGDDW